VGEVQVTSGSVGGAAEPGHLDLPAGQRLHHAGIVGCLEDAGGHAHAALEVFGKAREARGGRPLAFHAQDAEADAGELGAPAGGLGVGGAGEGGQAGGHAQGSMEKAATMHGGDIRLLRTDRCIAVLRLQTRVADMTVA